MPKLKINKNFEISDSTRSLDWIREKIEYLLSRDNRTIVIPTILYSGNSNGSITLSDNANNYDYIEIIYLSSGSGNDVFKSQKCYPAANRKVLLDSVEYHSSSMQFNTKVVNLNGNSLTVTSYKAYRFMDSVSWQPYGWNDNRIYITKVIGYKFI